MALTDAQYNAFARSLAARFADRARGLDEDSARIVALRPSDRVLAGLLTPAGDDRPGAQTSNGADATEPDILLADDLPRDKAYEQTAMGFEWVAPIQTLREGGTATVSLGLCIYLRRLPTFGEQRKNAAWRTHATPRGAMGPPAHSTASIPERETDVVAVWTRESFPRLSAEIDLGELSSRGRLRVNLSSQIISAWADKDLTDLYPGRHPVRLQEKELASKER